MCVAGHIPVAALRTALLAFYARERRDLPWRRTRDPYAIWVSEIMLQQTRVETVTARWAAFLARFPTVRNLAEAKEAAVCEAWAGLGYYRRARNLHAAARAVVQRHGGELPGDVEALGRLPGLGPYTVGAIASIAFGIEAPVVDGNVARVLSRLTALSDAPESASCRRVLWGLAAELVAGPSPGELNQALMELGALVCTPRAPRCEQCPVGRWCAASREGEPPRYPVHRRSARRALLEIGFAWLAGPRGVWLERRSLNGLWPGLWEPPSATGRRARRALAERLGVELRGPVDRLAHELTHRQVRARVYVPTAPPRMRSSATGRWTREPLVAPLSALARKVVVAMQGRLDANRL